MTENETPRRSVRVPKERWDAFAVVCDSKDTNASAALNAYMQSEIDNYREGASK